MRIVIDMQGVQSSGSRNRGIGRYTLSLVKAMVRNRGGHEIFLALSEFFPDSIEPIRAAFDSLLPQENIRVWNAVGPVSSIDNNNDWRRQSAERVREAFLASLRPDVVHVTSLFEGFEDDAVTSIGLLSGSIPTAVTLYDLIPYIHRKPYLENPAIETWYLEKIGYLRRADLWLAISESSRREGVNHLDLPDTRSVNISTDADSQFQPLSISAESEQSLRKKYGLHRPFVMYTGGIDHRKNIEGLIRAFAKLPESLRKAHQLAIVCSVQTESKHMLAQLAAQHGLSKNDVILTGFVPDDDLVALYNLCTLFVFPSLHEGFGLPALEAMRCGAPVIGANTSSVPEVIGWEEALFDPHSDEAMARAIEHGISNPVFRNKLIAHGKKQSTKFSWDESARVAITAMERLVSERKTLPEIDNIENRRPRMAYVSPLPPERSGIADYSAELLPELARYYEIDLIVAQDEIADPWLEANCTIRSIQWFSDNARRYERVLYHFGNSPFHEHMFGLLRLVPGVVVLHDFFLSGIVSHIGFRDLVPYFWEQELYNSHGYAALRDRFNCRHTDDVVWKYPCSLSAIQGSLGVIAHSSNSVRLAEQWYGSDGIDWSVIPLLREPPINQDKSAAREALGFSSGDFLVCSFGMLGPTKLNHRLLQAWLSSELMRDKDCHLIFVGDNVQVGYGKELLKAIHNSKKKQNIHITGWVSTEVYRQYLAAADIGVQLRTSSRGETSAAVLDCMNYGLAVIVNANGSMSDLSDEAVWKLSDEFSDEQLVEALETLWDDRSRRQVVGENAKAIILRDHNPRSCAGQYSDGIEQFYQHAVSCLPALPRAIADIHDRPTANADLLQLAASMARSFPQRKRQRQILVDISVLVQSDARSGIQRVVRNILWEWLNNPPAGYRVEPVYAQATRGHRYARQFTLKFLGCPDDVLQDEPMEYAPGDIFLALDLTHQITTTYQNYLSEMSRAGIRVNFLVYDLLPIQFPHYWEPQVHLLHQQWLNIITKFDGAVCISKSVADELSSWVEENGPARQRPFMIDWFHLGAEMDNLSPNEELPPNAKEVLKKLHNRNSFLMVGTLEPRKGHTQVLGAFEQYWQTEKNVNLVIVGKQGWMVDDLVQRLCSHPELNNRLFWLEGISDEYLEKVYAACTCLIAASYGEGFGLPLIEAAQHKFPIIARDIPVFREVAGEYAYYFDGKEPDVLAEAVKEWMTLYKNDEHPKSDSMPWLTWQQSARQLMQVLGI